MTLARTLAAVAALTLAAGSAQAADNCFRSSDMRNHTVANPHTLYLKVGLHDVYRVETAGNCLAGALPTDPIVTRQPPTSQLICKPLDLNLSVSKSGFETACIVRSITRLTAAEAKALPKKLQP